MVDDANAPTECICLRKFFFFSTSRTHEKRVKGPGQPFTLCLSVPIKNLATMFIFIGKFCLDLVYIHDNAKLVQAEDEKSAATFDVYLATNKLESFSISSKRTQSFFRFKLHFQRERTPSDSKKTVVHMPTAR